MPTSPYGLGDMYLEVKGKVHGPIKGESLIAEMKDKIEVLRWSWGMQARHQAGSPSGRATTNDLKIVKRVDRASTGLMLALRTNEELEATLTLRKAGPERALKYLEIKIKEGRVTSLTLEGGDGTGGADVLEHVSFTFGRITVDYTPQGADGNPQGALSFDDQWTKE